MFIQAEDLDLADFLKAISFIPPKGKTVEYFISPDEVDGPTPGYEREASSNDEDYVSESVVYTRKDPGQKIAQEDTPQDYANVDTSKIQNSGPKAPVVPQSIPTEALKCPFVDVLSDNNLGTDVILTENVGPFKRHTLFHCV